MRAAFWIAVLAVAAVFFGWETWTAWNSPSPPALPPAAGLALPPRPPGADNASRAADLAGQVAVIVTKPLFRPDRQPFLENAAEAPRRSYEAELAKLTLVGVLLQGDQRKGLVLGAGAGRQESWEVGAGDHLPGFTVREVQTDGLLVAADGKEFLLPLYAGAPKGQAGGSLRTETPAAAPPGPGSPMPQKAQPPPASPGAPPPMQPPAGRPVPQPGAPASPYPERMPFRSPRINPLLR